MLQTLSRLSPLPADWLKWSALVLIAGAVGQALHWLHVPAGLFLGPMLVAMGFGIAGARLRLHRNLFRAGQGCVGLVVAHFVTASVVLAVVQSWPLMLGATLATLVLSAAVGLATVRYGGLPGSTAAWGTAPGAASAMVSMAEEEGADARVVATMQYVRVVCVVLIGSLVSHAVGSVSPQDVPVAAHALPLAHMRPVDVLLSVAVVLSGIFASRKVPAGALLIPLTLGAVLQLGGVLHIALPSWVLATAYGAIGCYIGLRFDRATVRYVLRHLPTMLIGAVVLIALCAGCAWLLATWTQSDFLSMYLATSPGGLDALSIIAMETHADVGMVLAMQTLRLFAVVLSGAFIARQIIRLTQR